MTQLSLICTVRDEADNIAALLDSILRQTRRPDEIVINDCQSRDATPAMVRAYAAREPRIRLVTGGFNIASGRNSAIRQARGRLIACTDAGLTLDPGWLAAIIAPIEADHADLVGGFYAPAPTTPFEIALGATNFRTQAEIDPQRFLPAGNSMAFRKAVWDEVGGFPEWASHCEDLLFDMAAEHAGFRRAYAPNAIVHFRPRANFRAFARQYYWYARGDGLANLWPRRHAARYLAYSGLVGLALIVRRHPSLRFPSSLLIALGSAAYMRSPYRRLWSQRAAHDCLTHLQMLALLPLIRLVGDVAKMVGYPVGVVQRWRSGGGKPTSIPHVL